MWSQGLSGEVYSRYMWSLMILIGKQLVMTELKTKF